MTNVLKIMYDLIFSFGTFCVFMMGIFGFIFYMVIQSDHEKKEQTATCYKQQMILVDTPAGMYCVAPSNLVKVK